MLSGYNFGFAYIERICRVKLYHTGRVEMQNIFTNTKEYKNILSRICNFTLCLLFFIKLL